jgi:RibD domain-containing protein
LDASGLSSQEQADAAGRRTRNFQLYRRLLAGAAATGAPAPYGVLRYHRRYTCEMRPLRYSINVTLDGCCDHRAMIADEDLLKRESGKGLLVGGLKLPLALAELGLIDEYEFVVQPRLAGHGPTLFAGLSRYVDLKLVSRLEFGSGAVAMRYEPSNAL